jgi:response regulator RpfG family c-di-GMP phosphodiesterase
MADPVKHSSVLIIDNDKVTIEKLEPALKAKGYNVLVVYNGTVALEYLRKRIFDIVITNLDMPEVDGYQLLDTISSTQRDHKVMVISEDQETREHLLKRGILEAFGRPVSLEDFLEELVALLEQRRRTKRFEVKKEGERKKVACVVRNRVTKKPHQGDLLNISIDGALVELNEKAGDLEEVDLEFSLAATSNLICRVSGRIVRAIEETEGVTQLAIYFDNDRDLKLLELMAPHIHLDTKSSIR